MSHYGGTLAGTAGRFVPVTLGAGACADFTTVPHVCDVSRIERITLIAKNIPRALSKPSCCIVFLNVFQNAIKWRFNSCLKALSGWSHHFPVILTDDSRHWKLDFVSRLEHSASVWCKFLSVHSHLNKYVTNSNGNSLSLLLVTFTYVTISKMCHFGMPILFYIMPIWTPFQI